MKSTVIPIPIPIITNPSSCTTLFPEHVASSIAHKLALEHAGSSISITGCNEFSLSFQFYSPQEVSSAIIQNSVVERKGKEDCSAESGGRGRR